ncbi:hypothetical protein BDR07DRAFT_1409505, partial [Suillus spraguei]
VTPRMPFSCNSSKSKSDSATSLQRGLRLQHQHPHVADSPPTTNAKIQSIAYASLSFSLLAALWAVLGKQWLGYYKLQRYGRGSEEEQAKHRQEKIGETKGYNIRPDSLPKVLCSPWSRLPRRVNTRS